MNNTLSLNRQTCDDLDLVLAAFGGKEHLSKEELLEIFDNNEVLAADCIDILAQLGYVKKIGEVQGSRLGLAFYKEPEAYVFLSQGGFKEAYSSKLKEKLEADELQTLTKTNLQLQNETLKYQVTIREQEGKIRILDERVKRFEMLKNYEWIIRLSIGVISALIVWWYF